MALERRSPARRRARRAALVVTAGLVLAACGDDSTTGTTEVSAAVGSPPTTTAATTTDGDAGEAAGSEPGVDHLIEVSVAAGEASGDTGRQEADLGQTVVVRVTSDGADHVHVHGYDLFADVGPGSPAEIRFVAELPGVYEIELEDTGLLLAELAVS